MRAPSARTAGIAALCLAVVAVAVAVVTLGSEPGGTSSPAGELVVVERGDVSVTVGGVGHVTTLTGAARLTVSSSSASPAAQAGAGGSPSSASGGAARELPLDA